GMVADNLASSRPVLAATLAEARDSGLVQLFDANASYLEQLGSYVDLDLIRSAGIKAVVDPMFGAGCGLLPRLLPGITEIHGSENPSFGGHPPEPIAEHLLELSELVASGAFQV